MGCVFLVVLLLVVTVVVVPGDMVVVVLVMHIVIVVLLVVVWLPLVLLVLLWFVVRWGQYCVLVVLRVLRFQAIVGLEMVLVVQWVGCHWAWSCWFLVVVVVVLW